MNTAAQTVLCQSVEHRVRNALALISLCTGCGQNNDQTAPSSLASSAESAPFLSVPCAQSPLTLQENVAYAQFRQLRAGYNTVLLTQGTPCSGAEREQCLDSIAKFEKYTTMETSSQCDELDCPEQTYAIAVRRGRPELLTKPAELRELLGAIDKLDEAWLMAVADAKAVWPVCELPEMSAYRRQGASFELRGRRYSNRCPLTLSETTYKVSLDGTVSSSKPLVVSVREGTCLEGHGSGLTAP